MFDLPIYVDLIVRQGKTFNLPVILREEEYDDITGTITDKGPWDTAGMSARFTIRPVIADGEFGDPVIDVSTADGGVQVGIQGIPGLEVSLWVWISDTLTDVEPWGIGVHELQIDTGSEVLNVAEGTARLQRRTTMGPEV
jgi:hypothetical protein